MISMVCMGKFSSPQCLCQKREQQIIVCTIIINGLPQNLKSSIMALSMCVYIYFLVTFGSKGLSHPPRNITTTAAITSPMVQFSPYSSCCSYQEQNVYRVHIKTSTELLQVNNVTILKVKYLQIVVYCKCTPF